MIIKIDPGTKCPGRLPMLFFSLKGKYIKEMHIFFIYDEAEKLLLKVEEKKSVVQTNSNIGTPIKI
jgi:hypothetical protein